MSAVVEDVRVGSDKGRKPKDKGSYEILVGDADLNFRQFVLDDPIPTGRQVIEATGMRKAEERLVFQVLKNGELEELRLEETVDLREAGVERFLIFTSAESFRIDLDGKRLEWGQAIVSGRVLKRLAGVDPAKYSVWQEIRGAEDRLIADNDLVRLDHAGLERFFTGVSDTTEGSN